MIPKHHIVTNGLDFNLADCLTIGLHEPVEKQEAKNRLLENVKRMSVLQDKLYAQNHYGVLIIFQAMDTAGKDGAIKHVMSGLNPQGTHVHSFKAPTHEELDHDYLWRATKNLPERGQIGIFNRSYYEDVLVVKVHNLVQNQPLPKHLIAQPTIWEQRFRQIRDYEQHLIENGYIILKFFLHISKEEQRLRLLERIDDPSKNWKFEAGDIKERAYWDQYQQAYNEAIKQTASSQAPWYVVPSDKKWYARMAISEIIVQKLESLDLHYPAVSDAQKALLEKCRLELM